MINTGGIVYYARALPNAGLYEVLELKIRTKMNDFYVGVDEKTKQAFCFYEKDIDQIIFTSRKKALEVVKDIKSHSRQVSDELDYEDYMILS